MKKYVCSICGYEYDPELGVEEQGIAPARRLRTFPMILYAPSAGPQGYVCACRINIL